MFPVTIRGRRGRQSSQAGRPRRRGAIPRLEGLEGRTTPSTFVVTNAQDAGDGSLRWALGQANAHPGDDVVGLSPALAGRPIVLTSGGLVATDPTGLTAVVGLGAPASAVVRSPAARAFSVFEVLPKAHLNLTEMTISGGSIYSRSYGEGGGGVLNRGRLGMGACTVSNNSAYYKWWMYGYGRITTFEDEGGGIYNVGSMNLTNCAVTGNRGGGVSNAGTAALINCAVTGNGGFGVYNNGGHATLLTNCAVAGNQRGGVANWSSTVELAGCTVVGNRGDGVSNGFGTLKLTNCLVANNLGFGVFNGAKYSTAKLINSTVAGNQGSGIYHQPNVGVDTTLTNCILWGNGNGRVSPYFSGTITHSIVQGGLAGEGNSAADPLFVDAGRGNYRLRPGSPAIDAADTAAAPRRDRAGMPRPLDGNGDGVAAADLGAYEFSRTALLAFQASPVRARAFEALPAVVVLLRDAYGFPLAGREVTLSLPGGLLAGTLTARTDANGQAVFRGLRALTAGTFRLRASSPGLASAWSGPLAVAEGGPAWGARLVSALGRLPDRLRDALLGLPWPGA